MCLLVTIRAARLVFTQCQFPLFSFFVLIRIQYRRCRRAPSIPIHVDTCRKSYIVSQGSHRIDQQWQFVISFWLPSRAKKPAPLRSKQEPSSGPVAGVLLTIPPLCFCFSRRFERRVRQIALELPWEIIDARSLQILSRD